VLVKSSIMPTLLRWLAAGIAGLALAVTAGLHAAAQSSPIPGPTTSLLIDLIRVDTSNPPGREGAIAELLAPRFKALGFEVDIIPTPQPGKSHFVARLKGDGTRRPVLLAAHADVVGVERDKWTMDPFEGVVRDGYVFGRGALDFKGGMAVFARAVMMLAENKIPLARDVIFLAEADEEGALAYDASWLAEHHWPKIECEFALNEGGWIVKGPDGRVQYVSISTADKASLSATMTATGTSTHSSMPRPDSAIFRLARALAKVEAHRTEVTLIPISRQFFRTLARTSSPPLSQYFLDLTGDDPARIRRADLEISQNPLLHAIMRNTVAPVLMSAGFRSNVIPGSAEATLNLRIVPGTDPSDVVRELQRVIADPAVVVQLAKPSPGPSRVPPSSEDTELYRALERQARRVFDGAEVTPYLFQAGTDAGAWRSRGVPVYGVYPYPIDGGDLERMHGNDERVAVEALRQGTAFIYQTLVDVAARQ
jgi:acetylornithine deacetylase/succinyl-diaminopimelate desuccinylase-like protein